jgi:hypothetical protein
MAGGPCRAQWLGSASDIDVGVLAGLDHGNITVIRHDLERDGVPGGGFDLIHTRLVLEHLRHQQPPRRSWQP